MKIRVFGALSAHRVSERAAKKMIWRREAVWQEPGISIRVTPNKREDYITEELLGKLETSLGYDRRGMLTGREVKRIPVVVSEKLINRGTDQFSATALVGRVKLSKRVLVKDGVACGD